MFETTAKDMRWSILKLARYVADVNWRWEGVSGATCGSCKATANVVNFSHGWFCPCGAYNAGSSGHFMPFDMPQYGPWACEIKVAFWIVDLWRILGFLPPDHAMVWVANPYLWHKRFAWRER